MTLYIQLNTKKSDKFFIFTQFSLTDQEIHAVYTALEKIQMDQTFEKT